MCCHCKKLPTANLCTATELVNLKTMGEVIVRLFLINYLLGTNFTITVKSFKQLGVAKLDPQFTKFFRTWRTEGLQKNNLQVDDLQ